ncbi:MAG: hypothetical protein QOE90_59, partial [Thermoplasmata archaeon]|nr:hypothetical protein [Thermoplasmata archaeon]
MGSLRRIANIAFAEGFRTGGSFSKKSSLALLAIGVLTALLVPQLLHNGLDFDRGLYRVAVVEGSPLLPAVEGSRLFRVVQADPGTAVESGAADLAILDGRIDAMEGAKGEAAMAALRQAAKDYTFTQLAQEQDQGAAFPVRVELTYAQQARAGNAAALPSLPAQQAPTPSEPSPSPSGSGTVTGSGGTASAAPPGGSTGGFDFLPQERSVNTPETLSPPFPFRSLLLAYAFLIPMNFVVQVYAGSAIGERLGRKGEALLASPARPWEIIVGKALPYFALMMAVCAGIVLVIHGGWLSLVAVMPLAYAFLALEFVAAMFARSFRELTFLTVFTSVMLTIYAFLPAVFTEVHPIALISPISLVVMDLHHDPVTWGQILYATVPLTLFSTILFVLGAALYTEEDLFHQKPVMAKAVDMLARQVRSLGSAIKVQLMLIACVLVVELLLMTFLFAWPVPVGTLGILLAVALCEETFKGLPSYAAQTRGAIPTRRAVLFGALAGLGFFL